MPDFSIKIIDMGGGVAGFEPDLPGRVTGDPLYAPQSAIVSWANLTQETHQITVDDGTGFTTKEITPGVSSTPEYVAPTTYGAVTYSCTKHENETGQIVIEPVSPMDPITPILAFFAALALSALSVLPARAQGSVPPPSSQIPCVAEQQPLVKVPEVVSSNGRLRATLISTTEQDRMPSRYPGTIDGKPSQPGDPQTFHACFPEWVRVFRSPDTTTPWPMPTKGYYDPLNGPTLRARVGDVIELTYLNQIDPTKFGQSIDLGDQGACDATSAGYPAQAKDTFPNCFHGSTTGNIHFHGTHTNPQTTGDNVFLEILSSKRLTGEPAPPPPSFDDFFARCEAELAKGSHVEWPVTWDDLPSAYTQQQMQLLQRFDKQPSNGKPLWPVNEAALKKGDWPQYYIGAYPYCFKLPKYPETAPSTEGTQGAGQHEMMAHQGMETSAVTQQGGSLKMGQSPGTHWYHAHKHGSTTIDLSNGFSGAFIIEGLYDDEINNVYKAFGPQWTRTQPVLVINQFGTSPNLKGGFGQDKGPDFAVNGRIDPVISMKPGEVQMWRIVNTSGRAGTLFLGPPAGFHWRKLAIDGVQLANANYQNSLDQSFLIAAGNRVDLLVQAPSAPCNNKNGCAYPVQVHNTVSPTDLVPATPPARGPFNINLMTVKVSGTAVQMPFPADTPASTFPADLKDITDDEVKGTQTISFGTVPQSFANGAPPHSPAAVHTINNKQFNGEVGVSVLLNKVEEWTISNNTPNIAHPFHIHINPFQITQIFSPNVRMSGPITGAGTVSTTAGSPNVTGSGTAFMTQFRADDVITIGSNPVAVVASVQSDTAMTLTANATASGSNLTYTYLPPRYVVSTNDNAPILAGQCRLNPDKPPATWVPCSSDPNVSIPQPRIWWDVFPIPPSIVVNNSAGTATTINGFFKMRSRFVDYPGWFVIHCHILAHEDRGMMTVVEVTPLLSKYSHH